MAENFLPNELNGDLLAKIVDSKLSCFVHKAHSFGFDLAYQIVLHFVEKLFQLGHVERVLSIWSGVSSRIVISI